jgi:hypothetical protein
LSKFCMYLYQLHVVSLYQTIIVATRLKQSYSSKRVRVKGIFD